MSDAKAFIEKASKVKPELKTNVRAKSGEPKPKAKAKADAGAQSDDDGVEMTGEELNDSTDMEVWKQASAKELQNQLKLRYPNRYFKEWAFKSRDQLLEIIEELIKNKQWVFLDL